ncbi:hypothetical protein E4U09_003671 [Claviceps aff. purpurea]|uniref:BTB domain-containing protein n=1 Tax=Claviceps aff. purpurea TaxID=1967640 RepID=A0A9P7QE53_9HYPO|nr:hypothetical protein E4U09_003671 [Claviceps aff. purpurea]
METSPSEGVYTSQPVKFMVGEAKTEFYLHSALVASKSKALGKLIDDALAEGQQGCVVLEDDDVGTFTAFADFVYIRNYHLSTDLSSPDSGDASQQKGKLKDQGRQWGRPKNAHWSHFVANPDYRNLKKIGRKTRACNLGVSVPAPSFNLNTDYSEFLIAHAEIFDFAEHYGIDELKDLSMSNLHGALETFTLSRERIDDILALVYFCYDNERKNADRLNKMVASYSAAIMDSRVSDDVAKCFEGLLKKNAEFAADIAWFLACRAMRNGVC